MGVIKAIKNQIKNLNPIFKKDEEFAETLKEFTLLVNARKKNGAQADEEKDENVNTSDDDAKMATTDGLQEKDKNMDKSDDKLNKAKKALDKAKKALDEA